MLRRLPRATLRSRPLRWLAQPHGDASAEVRGMLLGGLLSSPGAVMMGAASGLIVSLVAVWLDPRPLFAVFLVLQIACTALRLVLIRAPARAAAAGAAPPIDKALAIFLLWCALQGAMAFAAMRTGISVLQTLSATMTMGIIGPIFTRNYPAPRLAFLSIALIDLPFVAGACASGAFWLWICLVPMTPLFLYGAWQIIVGVHAMALVSLSAAVESRDNATHDPLTGLKNRRAFGEALVEPASGLSGRFALLCVDLDGFKAINDSLGHHAGDLLLIGVAGRLKHSLRAEDSVFRLGGDEFAIIVRGLRPDQLDSIADRIIQDVSADAYRFEGLPPITIGASVGYACWPEDARSVTELHGRADRALYESKAAGKGVHRRGRRQGASLPGR